MSQKKCTFAPDFQQGRLPARLSGSKGRHNLLGNMTHNRCLILAALLACTLGVHARCGYCKTFEDLLADRWEPLDTVYGDKHGKSRQFWVGGNDYTLSTGDKLTDKKLKGEAFAVMQDKKLYVNSRKLRYQKTRFTNGFTRAMRIGRDTLIFANQTIGAASKSKQAIASNLFGAVGGGLVAANSVSRRVCYIICGKTDQKGRVEIEMVDDSLMEKLLKGRDELREEYYAEQEKSQRILASYIIPILRKAGLLGRIKQEATEDSPKDTRTED